MTNELFDQQIDEMRKHLLQSHRMLGAAPAPYREVLTDAFSQIDVTLEELQVAEHELRQQSEALAESAQQVEYERRRYRSLFEFAPLGYIVTDVLGIIREANLASSILLSVEPKFLIRKPLPSFIDTSERAAFRYELANFKRTAYIPDWEVTISPRNGASFTASIMASAERNANGDIECIRWLIRDITERKRAEQRILDLNRELEARVAERTAELAASVERERHVTQILIQGMLERTSEDAFPGLGVRTLYAAASDDLLVGGDFFDAFAFDSGAVAFVAGDVSGKGVKAASYTAEIKYTLRAYLQKTESPENALMSLNEYLCDILERRSPEDTIFATLAIAIIDVEENAAIILTAGSEPVLILRSDGGIERIHCAGLPVGIFHGSIYERRDVPFNHGDRILLLTDGITETRKNGNMLGIEGTIALVEQTRRLSLAEAGQFIIDGARAFADDGLQDDTCLIVAERRAGVP